MFSDYVDVTAYDGERLKLSEMIERTKAEMKKGTPVICEASFSFGGLYCAVDILRKTGDGWEIYEVKSSTKVKKDVFIADVAYQKYVLENCGVDVCGEYLVSVNNKYVFDGVTNGTKAMNLFPKLKDMGAEDREKARNSLLRYCELDTYAMVTIYNELVRVVR